MGRTRRRNKTRSRATWLALGLLAGALPAIAQSPEAVVRTGQPISNININPKRVTFDRLGKSGSIHVFYQGGGAATFDVQLIDRIMLDSGQIIPLSEAGDRADAGAQAGRLKSARALLVVTPRRIDMTGNASQTIRVRATGSPDLPPGEYRTHLTVIALPPADTGLVAEQAAARRDNRLSFQVNTTIGLSIPVIVRVGPVDVRAQIERPAIALEADDRPGQNSSARVPVLSFDLVRIGANSVFGDILIRGDKERGESKDPLGVVRGIAVYPEIERRAVKIVLGRVPARGEPVEIVFRDDDVTPGKQLARVVLPAP